MPNFTLIGSVGMLGTCYIFMFLHIGKWGTFWGFAPRKFLHSQYFDKMQKFLRVTLIFFSFAGNH